METTLTSHPLRAGRSLGFLEVVADKFAWAFLACFQNRHVVLVHERVSKIHQNTCLNSKPTSRSSKHTTSPS